MVIVSGTVRIDPAKADAFMPHAKTMLAETRKEAGCIVYSFSFDVEDPGLVRIYEEWESREHLAAHFEVPHMADWRAALADLGAYDRNVKVYRVDGEAEQL